MEDGPKILAFYMKEKVTATSPYVLAIMVLGGLLWTTHAVLAALSATYFSNLRDKGCACATDNRGTFLFIASCIYIGLAPLLFVLHTLRTLVHAARGWITLASSVLSLLNFGLTIAVLYFGYQYLAAIEEEKCACAKEDERWKVLQTWIYFWTAQIGLAVLLTILAVVLAVFVTRKRLQK